jgi:hypothetical protein
MSPLKTKINRYCHLSKARTAGRWGSTSASKHLIPREDLLECLASRWSLADIVEEFLDPADFEDSRHFKAEVWVSQMLIFWGLTEQYNQKCRSEEHPLALSPWGWLHNDQYLTELAYDYLVMGIKAPALGVRYGLSYNIVIVPTLKALGITLDKHCKGMEPDPQTGRPYRLEDPRWRAAYPLIPAPMKAGEREAWMAINFRHPLSEAWRERVAALGGDGHRRGWAPHPLLKEKGVILSAEGMKAAKRGGLL